MAQGFQNPRGMELNSVDFGFQRLIFSQRA
jgi:hypothetical protein